VLKRAERGVAAEAASNHGETNRDARMKIATPAARIATTLNRAIRR
jgi:hypothetical protein